MKTGLKRVLMTGAMAVILATGPSLPVFSGNASLTPEKASVARSLSAGKIAAYAEEVVVGVAPGSVATGIPVGSGSEPVTAGAGSETLTAGSSTSTNTETSGVPVSAGSGTVTTGGGSATITVGAGTSTSYGPGGPGVSTTEISKGTDGFAGTVEDPIVTVTGKYTFSQMEQDIRELQSRYGSLLQVNTIGTSLDGRSIYELVLGNASASKHILIHAGIHAREYMTPLLVMKQLEYGLYFYQTGSYNGQLLSDLLNRVAIHYVPMVNPDGIAISQSGLSGIRSSALQATIRQCYDYDVSASRTTASFEEYLPYWKSNARGVDLNQNFPANWDLVTSADAPSYATYKGDSPLSEPESQALANLTESRSWAAAISYHSMGDLIYWDYEGNRVSEASQNLANLVVEKTGYQIAGSSGHGGFKDWVQIKDNPIPGLTIEVGSVACPMPVTEFTNVWNCNSEVWVALAAALQ
ncbi:MAG: peptidase [Clostridiales bacterium]|nr:peptidase [Clostridiales bacterium]